MAEAALLATKQKRGNDVRESDDRRTARDSAQTDCGLRNNLRTTHRDAQKHLCTPRSRRFHLSALFITL